MNNPLTSREYKITLNANNRLYKDWSQHDFSHLQTLITYTCDNLDIEYSGECKLYEQFAVTYMDTPEWDLYKNGWIFRIRRYYSKPANEYTIKFRSPDRYFSATKNVDCKLTYKDVSSIEYKFEEDITADPFHSNFSPSCNVFTNDLLGLSTFEKASNVFPGIADLNLKENTPLTSVKNKQILQEVWKGLNVKFGHNTYKIKIVLWWSSISKKPKDLVFGEIMFRLKSKHEDYSKYDIIDAHNFYLKLNEYGLNTGWVDPQGMTKTRFVYDDDSYN